MMSMEKTILEKLFGLILDRKKNPAEGSYTCNLFAKGKDEILKKIGEEATELIIAAKGTSKERIIEELSDLYYHILVFLANEELMPEDIYKELERRYKESRE